MTLYVICCCLPFFVSHFSGKEKKSLEANLRADNKHLLGCKSHVSISRLVGLLLAIRREICDRACAPFRPMFAAKIGPKGPTPRSHISIIMASNNPTNVATVQWDLHPDICPKSALTFASSNFSP